MCGTKIKEPSFPFAGSNSTLFSHNPHNAFFEVLCYDDTVQGLYTPQEASVPDNYHPESFYYSVQGNNMSRYGMHSVDAILPHPNFKTGWMGDMPLVAVGASPLFLAALAGNLKVVSKLLGAGADPMTTNDRRMTLLHAAAKSGNAKLISHLLTQCGADVQNADANGKTALHYAAELGHIEAIRALLENFADIDPIEFCRGWTPIFFAAAEGEDNAVYFLLAHGANFEAMAFDSKIPLHVAVGYTSVVLKEADRVDREHILRQLPQAESSESSSSWDQTQHLIRMTCIRTQPTHTNIHLYCKLTLLSPHLYHLYNVDTRKS